MAGRKLNINPQNISADIDTPTISQTGAAVSGHVERIQQAETKEKNCFEIKSIYRHKIRLNKKNNYPREDLENMKESILRFGLQQNLTVAYLTEEDMYVIEAGETRTRTLDELISEFESYPEDSEDPRYLLFKKNVLPYKLNGYPCKISAVISDGIQYDYDADTDLADVPDEVIDSEIRLIITNEVSRTRTPSTIASNISRLNALYNRKNINAKNNNDKINVNKAIAENLDLSVSQVKNYKAIDNLIPELKEEFEKNNITLKEGSNYSKLTESEQNMILNMIRAGQKVTPEEVALLLREKKELTDQVIERDKKIKVLQEEKSNTDDQQLLAKKDDEIKLLKKEIEVLNSKSDSKTSSFTPNHSTLAKADLSARAAFESCKKGIQCYLDAIAKLTKASENVPAEDIATLGILTSDDARHQLMQLEELLAQS